MSCYCHDYDHSTPSQKNISNIKEIYTCGQKIPVTSPSESSLLLFYSHKIKQYSLFFSTQKKTLFSIIKVI
jgi:hypothetical protein